MSLPGLALIKGRSRCGSDDCDAESEKHQREWSAVLLVPGLELVQSQEPGQCCHGVLNFHDAHLFLVNVRSVNHESLKGVEGQSTCRQISPQYQNDGQQRLPLLEISITYRAG